MIKTEVGGNWLPKTSREIDLSVGRLESCLSFQSVHDRLDHWVSMRTPHETIIGTAWARKTWQRRRLAILNLIARYLKKSAQNKLPEHHLTLLHYVNYSELTVQGFFDFAQKNRFTPHHAGLPQMAYDAIAMKFLLRMTKVFGFTSPIHYEHSKEVALAWANKHLSRWIKNDFATKTDCFYIALKEGKLEQDFNFDWLIRDEEILKARLKRLKIDKPDGLNRYANRYFDCCTSLIYSMTLADLRKGESEEFVNTHFATSWKLYKEAKEKGVKTKAAQAEAQLDLGIIDQDQEAPAPSTSGVVWYFSKQLSWSLRHLEPLLRHVRHLATQNELNEANLARWTVNNVLASYIGQNSAELAKKAAEAQARRAAYESYFESLQPVLDRENLLVYKLDSSLSRKTIAAILAMHTDVLQHCVGSAGMSGRRGGGQWRPMMNVLTGEINESGHGGEYMRSVKRGGCLFLCGHDAKTGEPVATAQVHKRHDGFLNIGQVSGFENGKVDAKYRDQFSRFVTEFLDGQNRNLIRGGLAAHQEPADEDQPGDGSDDDWDDDGDD